MAASGPTPGEDLAKARRYLQQLEGVANTDHQVKATAAAAHAVLALAEQVGMLRHQLRDDDGNPPAAAGQYDDPNASM